jgi:hypothetical protein
MGCPVASRTVDLTNADALVSCLFAERGAIF